MAVIKIVPMPGAKGDQGDDGATGAQGLQGPIGETGPAGADALWNYNGEWSPSATYAEGDVVTYNGQTYYATGITTLATTPDIDLNFDLIAAKGADGLNGVDGAQGPQGEPGPKGDQGDPGISGTTGLETWTRYSPVFQATGLTFTGSGATYPTYNSYYVKAGKLVSFVIEVDLSTVTNFGTGQYKLQLPFTPAFGYNHFSGWIWADPNISPDVGTGHTILNADTAGITDVLDLHYLKQSGGANSPIREGLFVQGTPVTLSNISNIYVNGTYISQ